jgi:hypothetical protein
MKYYKHYIFGNPPLMRDKDTDPWLLPDGTVYDPLTWKPGVGYNTIGFKEYNRKLKINNILEKTIG